MLKYVCRCGYIYNPEYGDMDGEIEAGVTFQELPDTWVCPFCGRGKNQFKATKKGSKHQFRVSD